MLTKPHAVVSRCSRCKRSAIGGRAYCRKCLNEYQRALRRKHREARGWGQCLWCGKQLTGKQRVACSSSCSRMIYKRRTKQRYVNSKGGKCGKCSYLKSLSALVFHHRDPGNKVFGLTEKPRSIHNKKLQEELRKCDLLCLNCHAELHDEILDARRGPKNTQALNAVLKRCH